MGSEQAAAQGDPGGARPRAIQRESLLGSGLIALCLGGALCLSWSRPELSMAGPVDLPVEWTWLEQPAARWDDVEVPERPGGNRADAKRRGSKLYERLCGDCHGAEGDGQGLLAANMRVRPRAFSKEWFRFRSVDGSGHARPEDIFRSITAGIAASGMPSFAHLSTNDRWDLVAAVEGLAATFQGELEAGKPFPMMALETRDEAASERGRKIFERLECSKCHGSELRGDGPSAPELKDDLGHRIAVPNLRLGRQQLKSGGSPLGFARILWTGLPGSPMPSFSESFELSKDEGKRQLSDLAWYLTSLVDAGDEARREGWVKFFKERQGWGGIKGEKPAAEQVQRWSGEAAALPEKAGCAGCHQGIEEVSTGAMASAIAAFGGGDADRQCTVCHEGQAKGATKAEAHRGMIGNPGSLWVTSVGLGCGKCHSDHNVMSSLHGRPLPEAVGGHLMTARSEVSDPSGASGANHAYRMQRGLMALEFGKVTHVMRSGGVQPHGTYRFADFDIDDTDGPSPSAGTAKYKEYMAKAEAAGQIVRVNKGEALPSFDSALAMLGEGSEAKAGYADYYRKDCGRCHLWGEGKASEGEHRSAGCAACHVPKNEDGTYEGSDRLIPKNKPGHAARHQVILSPPVSQCNHCHTRGQSTHEDEIHTKLGMLCGDCHTSIDVHGDGNLYPSIPFQMEVRCADCHGTSEKYPWELSIGHDSTKLQLEGERGVYSKGGKDYLLTSRGNPRSNWRRIDGQVVIASLDGKGLWLSPLVKDRAKARAEAAKDPATPKPARFRDLNEAHSAKHIEGMECHSCHSSKTPRCVSCHVDYLRSGAQTDWVLTGLRFDPKSNRQVLTETPGTVRSRDRYSMTQRWLPGEWRKSRRDKWAHYVTGCQVSFTYYSEDLKTDRRLILDSNPGQEQYPTGLGPVMTHEWEKEMIGCESCHPDPEKGPTKLGFDWSGR